MANTFGNYFKVTTFGESHGKCVGCVIDGCAPNLSLSEKDIQIFLDKRKPGQSPLTSPRQENDSCEIVSGIFKGKTLGSPICILIRNTDQKSDHYLDINQVYRPNHADYTYEQKYQYENTPPGGGRASARETIGRVASGAVAKIFVQSILPSVRIITTINRVHNQTKETQIENVILQAKEAGDSVGGTIYTVIENIPAGFGEPVFDKLEAVLAQAMMSIPAVKFFDSGDGLNSTYKFGSENNDAFAKDVSGNIYTTTNHSGGIQGGISNGMPITFTIGLKPTSTIFKNQQTVSRTGEEIIFTPKKGRHDPCVLPRALIIVESMAWIVLADMLKAHQSLGIIHLKDIQHT